MPRQVMHADERDAQAVRERLAEREADEQRSDESRPRRHRDPGELLGRDPRDVERALDHLVHRAHVVARRELGHDAAVRPVHGVLALDDARGDLAPVAHDGGRHLVARALDA